MSTTNSRKADGILLGHVKQQSPPATNSELISLLKRSKAHCTLMCLDPTEANVAAAAAASTASHHPGFVVGGGSMPTITSPIFIQQERVVGTAASGNTTAATTASGPSPSASPAPLPLTALQRLATWWAAQGTTDDGRLPALVRLKEHQGPQLKVDLDETTTPTSSTSKFPHLARLKAHSTGRPNRLESMIPACYNASPAPPAAAKLSAMTDETLLYIFYGMPGDPLQRLAARELQGRHWRWHREMSMWLVRESDVAAAAGGKDLASQMATMKLDPKHFIVFDPNTWTRIRRELPSITDVDWLDLASQQQQQQQQQR